MTEGGPGPAGPGRTPESLSLSGTVIPAVDSDHDDATMSCSEPQAPDRAVLTRRRLVTVLFAHRDTGRAWNGPGTGSDSAVAVARNPRVAGPDSMTQPGMPARVRVRVPARG